MSKKNKFKKSGFKKSENKNSSHKTSQSKSSSKSGSKFFSKSKSSSAPHKKSDERSDQRSFHKSNYKSHRPSSDAPRSHADRPQHAKAPTSFKSAPAIVDGRIEIHPDGFGFLIADDPTLPNIYVVAETLKYAMNRDRVRVSVEPSSGPNDKIRGRLVEIIQRAQKEFLGLIRFFKGGALAIPFDAKDRKHAFKVNAYATPELENLKSGTAVVCKILEYPKTGNGTVLVEASVEDPSAPSNDTLKVLVGASWPRQFTTKAIQYAEKRSRDWKNEIGSHVRDIRNLPLVTIDGRDAKDFDDAVFAKKHNGIIKCTVAIADVSHFVGQSSVLDIEAIERSTSVYFPDFVVPMLPEVLSNGVCSLNPDEDRLCLAVDFELDAKGHITKYDFYQGLMRSHKRFTYEEVQAYMDKEPWAIEQFQNLKTSLNDLEAAFHVLHQARKNRGSIDLDLPEALVILEKNGTVKDIQSRSRLNAHRLIEELMLAANECAAKFIHSKFEKGIYRIHEVPEQKKVETLISFLDIHSIPWEKSLGFHKNKESIPFKKPQDFARLLELLKKTLDPQDPTGRAVQSLVLRSMKQARYSALRVGHFALASMDYTHFTSPIRRYPDLRVHRLVKEALGISYPRESQKATDLEAEARHCSDRERLAMETERKLIDIKKCRYMEKHLGEEFDAFVTGVTEKGAFCQVENHYVDGLVSADMLGKAFRMRFLPDFQQYVGPAKNQLKIGTRLRILVAAVDIETRRIDFEPLEIYPSGVT